MEIRRTSDMLHCARKTNSSRSQGVECTPDAASCLMVQALTIVRAAGVAINTRHTVRSVLLLALTGLVGNLQIVLYAENTGDAVGADERDFLVALGIDNAIELDVPVLHRDADGLGGVDRVLVECRVSIDGAGNSETYLVVHDGDRIDFDVADYVLDTWVG